MSDTESGDITIHCPFCIKKGSLAFVNQHTAVCKRKPKRNPNLRVPCPIYGSAFQLRAMERHIDKCQNYWGLYGDSGYPKKATASQNHPVEPTNQTKDEQGNNEGDINTDEEENEIEEDQEEHSKEEEYQDVDLAPMIIRWLKFQQLDTVRMICEATVNILHEANNTEQKTD